MMDWFDFIDGTRVALYQCAALAMRFRGKVEREDKEPEQYQLSTAVSDVDRVCQEIILLHAHRVMPDAEICGEEIDELPPQIRGLFDGNRCRHVLVIDPIDGTDCYLGRGDKYAHMCGVLDQEAGEMVCSLVYFPELGRLYSAVRGGGSFVEDSIFGTPRPLAPAAAPRTFGQVKRLKASDYVAFRKSGFSLDDSENQSAAYAQVRVAEGELGAMVMRHFHGYDTAITSLIIEELGGAVLGDDGRKVRYDKAMARMPLVVSSLSPDFAAALFEAQRAAPPDPD